MGESSTGPTGSLSAVLETAMPGDWDVMGVADCRSAAAIRVLMVGSDGDSPLGSGESPITSFRNHLVFNIFIHQSALTSRAFICKLSLTV